MDTYDAPRIVDLGSVESLTRGTGDDWAWDSNLGILANAFGFLTGNPSGNLPSASGG